MKIKKKEKKIECGISWKKETLKQQISIFWISFYVFFIVVRKKFMSSPVISLKSFCLCLCFLINLFFFLDLIKYHYVTYIILKFCITGKARAISYIHRSNIYSIFRIVSYILYIAVLI